ncbi:MAG: hypothetical protein M1826_001738 [Phylliscum demangeonii]|nr:MAG: hypothetical protein M1826_001738 [Phylliscum demangeonii]
MVGQAHDLDTEADAPTPTPTLDAVDIVDAVDTIDARPLESNSNSNTTTTTTTATATLAHHLTIISHLIFFSFLGTLARIGLQRWTTYTGAPVVTGVVWANVAGCFAMGVLSGGGGGNGGNSGGAVASAAAATRATATATRPTKHPPKTTPTTTTNIKTKPQTAAVFYIGATTGFCGCLTSFSAFMRDVFLAMADDLPPYSSYPLSFRRGALDRIMAALALLLLTPCLSLAALQGGRHLAAGWAHVRGRVRVRVRGRPSVVAHRLVSPSSSSAAAVAAAAVMLLAWCSWLAILLLAILLRLTPHRDILFSLVLAPLGCLARYYTLRRFNHHHHGRPGIVPRGTLAVNVLGTLLLGVAWDLQHARGLRLLTCSGSGGAGGGGGGAGGVVACQMLQAVQDGFCGALTTVSTWVCELSALRTARAYRYAGLTLLLALLMVIVVMGGLCWSSSSEAGAGAGC